MERDINQSALPTLCRAGCGFYGSPATDSLCSKCFKDTLKRKQDPGRISPTTSGSKTSESAAAQAVTAAIESLVAPIQATCSSTSIGSTSNTAIADAGIAQTAVESSNSTPSSSSSATSADQQNMDVDGDKAAAAAASTSTKTKQKNRCDFCRKRVGLTGFECRCGGTYCAVHRYSDLHECSFDYKALGEEEIRKNNPVVKTEKIQKL